MREQMALVAGFRDPGRDPVGILSRLGNNAEPMLTARQSAIAPIA
jgi:hypothetical protein